MNKKGFKVCLSMLLILLASILLFGCNLNVKKTDVNELEKKFVFKEYDDNYELEKYIGNESTVDIPKSYKGKNVVRIGDDAFKKCYFLKAVYVPNSIKEIGESAFESCINLYSFLYNDSFNIIQNNAFKECVSLEKLKLSCEYCHDDNFKETKNIKELHFNKGKGSIRGNGKILFNLGKNSLESLTLPDYCIRTINYDFFSGSKSLKTIVLGDGIEEIGKSVFRGCENLEKVICSSSLKKIGEDAFNECTNLREITLNEGLYSIGNNAFSKCIKLKKIIIPLSVKEAGYYIFYGCSKNLLICCRVKKKFSTFKYSLNQVGPDSIVDMIGNASSCNIIWGYDR